MGEHNVYEGRYITVTEETIDYHTYERMYLRPGIVVLPVNQRKILLILEDRVHEVEPRWKLVSGWMDKDGLDDLEIAQEELAEEVGMASDQWEKLPFCGRSRNTLNVPIAYFAAHNPYHLSNPPQNPDNDVVLERKWVDFAMYNNLLDDGAVMWDRDALYALKFLESISE